MSKETTKEKIIFAATKIFTEKSYSSTTVGDIVKKSGLSSSTIYRYFTDKEAIAVSVIRYAVSRLERVFLPNGSPTLEEQINSLENYFNNSLDFVMIRRLKAECPEDSEHLTCALKRYFNTWSSFTTLMTRLAKREK